LYKTFEMEWYVKRMTWTNFIKFKDLGIEYKSGRSEIDGVEKYIITDAKKWVLAKIKYGI